MGFSARWLRLHELIGGNLYVICDSRACIFMVRNQINYALGTRLVSLHLTNLVDLQAGKRGEGESSGWRRRGGLSWTSHCSAIEAETLHEFQRSGFLIPIAKTVTLFVCILQGRSENFLRFGASTVLPSPFQRSGK